MDKLRTEQNTAAMGERAERAAYRAKLGKRGRLQSDFEHGQWWITNLDTGAQWSVNDAEGSEANGVFSGFCFEQVTKGDDE